MLSLVEPELYWLICCSPFCSNKLFHFKCNSVFCEEGATFLLLCFVPALLDGAVTSEIVRLKCWSLKLKLVLTKCRHTHTHHHKWSVNWVNPTLEHCSPPARRGCLRFFFFFSARGLKISPLLFTSWQNPLGATSPSLQEAAKQVSKRSSGFRPAEEVSVDFLSACHDGDSGWNTWYFPPQGRFSLISHTMFSWRIVRSSYQRFCLYTQIQNMTSIIGSTVPHLYE